jgi:glycosyltransferase involved in cell wall biosynthesis
MPDPRFASLDLLHVPFQTPPTYDLPYICTMHDVQELHFPEYFSAKEREVRAIHYRKSLENAVRIVVSFEHVKSDLIRFFGCPEDKVRVMPLPYRNCMLRQLETPKLAETAAKYSGVSPFFLYPAQTWVHKNHLLLIEAFERTRAMLGFPVSLVCTGKLNDYFEVIEKRLQTSEYASSIHFKGIVDEGELRWLYENCLGVVIPTRYEAGCFPLIEAMSMSAPVICSNVTSLPDTLDNTKYLFDPQDPRELTDLMIRLASDEEFREANRSHGRNRIEQLKRADVAGPYFQLWSEVLEELYSK